MNTKMLICTVISDLIIYIYIYIYISDMGSIQFRNWNLLFLKTELELRNFELELKFPKQK